MVLFRTLEMKIGREGGRWWSWNNIFPGFYLEEYSWPGPLLGPLLPHKARCSCAECKWSWSFTACDLYHPTSPVHWMSLWSLFILIPKELSFISFYLVEKSCSEKFRRPKCFHNCFEFWMYFRLTAKIKSPLRSGVRNHFSGPCVGNWAEAVTGSVQGGWRLHTAVKRARTVSLNQPWVLGPGYQSLLGWAAPRWKQIWGEANRRAARLCFVVVLLRLFTFSFSTHLDYSCFQWWRKWTGARILKAIPMVAAAETTDQTRGVSWESQAPCGFPSCGGSWGAGELGSSSPITGCIQPRICSSASSQLFTFIFPIWIMGPLCLDTSYNSKNLCKWFQYDCEIHRKLRSL